MIYLSWEWWQPSNAATWRKCMEFIGRWPRFFLLRVSAFSCQKIWNVSVHMLQFHHHHHQQQQQQQQQQSASFSGLLTWYFSSLVMIIVEFLTCSFERLTRHYFFFFFYFWFFYVLFWKKKNVLLNLSCGLKYLKCEWFSLMNEHL